jgi:hypothetical protein
MILRKLTSFSMLSSSREAEDKANVISENNRLEMCGLSPIRILIWLYLPFYPNVS